MINDTKKKTTASFSPRSDLFGPSPGLSPDDCTVIWRPGPPLSTFLTIAPRLPPLFLFQGFSLRLSLVMRKFSFHSKSPKSSNKRLRGIHVHCIQKELHARKNMQVLRSGATLILPKSVEISRVAKYGAVLFYHRNSVWTELRCIWT